MGLNLKDLVVREKTTLEAFSNKIIAIDAYNAIYQFLASIRGPDGLQLTDSEGRITSHLSGLLYRNVNFLSLGIKPVYVFDGKPPSLKTAEIERRKQIKKDATVKYEKAIAEGNMEDARKFAQQTTSMRDGMVKESKEFLTHFGIPYIEAPSEGEATAAHLGYDFDVMEKDLENTIIKKYLSKILKEYYDGDISKNEIKKLTEFRHIECDLVNQKSQTGDSLKLSCEMKADD